MEKNPPDYQPQLKLLERKNMEEGLETLANPMMKIVCILFLVNGCLPIDSLEASLISLALPAFFIGKEMVKVCSTICTYTKLVKTSLV